MPSMSVEESIPSLDAGSTVYLTESDAAQLPTFFWPTDQTTAA